MSGLPLLPLPAMPLSEYSHILLKLTGNIRVSGEVEAGFDEVYALICAEAKKKKFSQLERDCLELLLWSSVQTFLSTVTCSRLSNTFFGPSSFAKELVPRATIYMLSKRTSIPEQGALMNISASGLWSMATTDWTIDINIKGLIKKLSLAEAAESSLKATYLYLKADKFNPYYSMSSYISPIGFSKRPMFASDSEGEYNTDYSDAQSSGSQFNL
ncbi:TPA_asm: M [Cypripedium gammacytorhabdovirus 1]|nr:TPA_asm: M [Cypripedium gammacytorhabdovirus 1]